MSAAVGTTARETDLRLRVLERSLFGHYRLDPSERTVELDHPRVTVRLLEFGTDIDNPPVLLLHYLAEHVLGVPRCYPMVGYSIVVH